MNFSRRIHVVHVVKCEFSWVLIIFGCLLLFYCIDLIFPFRKCKKRTKTHTHTIKTIVVAICAEENRFGFYIYRSLLNSNDSFNQQLCTFYEKKRKTELLSSSSSSFVDDANRLKVIHVCIYLVWIVHCMAINGSERNIFVRTNALQTSYAHKHSHIYTSCNTIR